MAGTQITRAHKEAAVKTLTAATAKQAPLLKAMRIREEEFSRVLINALMKQPQLALCTKDSLFQAVFTACDIGLMPDGRHGAIVPVRKNNVLTADFWPMVGGLLTCVRRELKSVAIQAHNVFEGDEWIDERGTSPRLFHRPNPGVDRLSEAGLVCSYATVHMAGNAVAEFEVMYRDELRKFRKNNRGPWSTHPLEMYRVRPLKRVLKRLPISGGLMAKLNRGDDDDFEVPTGDTFEGELVGGDPNPPPPPPRPEDPPPADPPGDAWTQEYDRAAGTPPDDDTQAAAAPAQGEILEEDPF